MRPTSSGGLRGVGLACFALGLSAYAWWPALAAYPATQLNDGGFGHEMIEATRASLVRFHELPLWNPFQCGGVPLWDNPQGFSAAPVFWPFLAFDTTRAIELFYVVHSALGFLCMWLLARRELGLSRGAALVSSAMWAFAGTHSQHLTMGHIVFVSYLYSPLAVLLWRRAEHELRMAVGLGMLVALEFYEAGVEPLAHLAVLLGAETLTRLWPPRRAPAVIRAGGIVLLVAFSLAAARLIPVIEQLMAHSRELPRDSDALQLSTLQEMFLARDHINTLPGHPPHDVSGQHWGWFEYGDYLGPFLLGLSLLGIALAGTQNLWLLALLVAGTALMAGHQGPYWPWAVLNGHVFPFKQMRIAARFNDWVTLCLAPFAGIGIDAAARLARRGLRSPAGAEALAAALLALGLIGVGDLVGVGVDQCRRSFTGVPAAQHVTASPRFYVGGPDVASFIDQPAQNRGGTDCWEEWAFHRDAAIWTGDVPQARADDPAVTVANVVRTPSTFSFDVGSPGRPAHVWLNSTWDAGWRATTGTVADDAGRLSVDVPAGEHRVIVRYWPLGLTFGLTLSGLAIVVLIALFVRDRRRRRPLRQ